MSASLNKVQVIGNLGRDPEIRFTGDGRAIANLTLATSEKWKDKSGQQQEKTEWHRIVVFGNLADVIQKYLKKGDNVYFEGKLQTRKWTGNDGQEKYTTEIVVDRGGQMVMLGSRSGAGASAPAMEGDFDQSAAPMPAAATKTTQVNDDDDAFDDDVPF